VSEASSTAQADLMLADDMARFYADPLGFVMYAYDWDNDPSLQIVKLQSPYDLIYGARFGPDLWACEFLDDIGRQVRERGFDGVNAVEAIREAIASGHGIGKSAITAWLVNWIMSTRPFCKGTVTANTAEQLASKTWAEIAKWTKRCVTGHWFTVTTGKGAMRMTHNEHPESWYCNAQTCREENSEAFAGQHAADSTSFYIFDEASAVPDAIEEVSEGGMTDGEPMKFAFGNPTRNTGWFSNCFKRMKHRWGARQIDSRTVQITNKKLLQQWIDDYGIDSDFVKVRVRGMFPSMSARQFISVADVDAAFGRPLRPEQYQWAPKILTIDPAWEGDDMLEIGLRQGLRFEILRTIPKNDNDLQVASIIAQLEDDHKADAVFVDGGFGTGIVSAGRTLKRNWQIVWFGAESSDPGCVNKRAEMWKAARDWLKAGGSIPGPDVQGAHELYNDLIGPEVVGRMDGKIQLEAKKDMKRRGLPSPGKGDALALSFAYPVAPKPRGVFLPTAEGAHGQQQREHDPFANMTA
jgi:hypothetical protein